jgi:sigma-54 specific flagellar transcriptional regulator A
MQVKLLRVLRNILMNVLAAPRTLKTDVRIIAATHKNLEEMIVKGSFREDLYYRLNVFPIEIGASKGAGRRFTHLNNRVS